MGVLPELISAFSELFMLLTSIPQCLNLAYIGISSIIEEFMALPVIWGNSVELPSVPALSWFCCFLPSFTHSSPFAPKADYLWIRSFRLVFWELKEGPCNPLGAFPLLFHAADNLLPLVDLKQALRSQGLVAPRVLFSSKTLFISKTNIYNSHLCRVKRCVWSRRLFLGLWTLRGVCTEGRQEGEERVGAIAGVTWIYLLSE